MNHVDLIKFKHLEMYLRDCEYTQEEIDEIKSSLKLQDIIKYQSESVVNTPFVKLCLKSWMRDSKK